MSSESCNSEIFPEDQRGKNEVTTQSLSEDFKKTIKIAAGGNIDDSNLWGHIFLQPTVKAAVTIGANDGVTDKSELVGLVNALTEQTHAIADGNLKPAESMLIAQAHTLDALFNNLAMRALKTEHMNNFDKFLKLALRAQSQCRSTWEAVATIKNPPMMGYIQQANIAHGPQQVNNGVDASSKSQGEKKNQNLQNKLLKEQNG